MLNFQSAEGSALFCLAQLGRKTPNFKRQTSVKVQSPNSNTGH